MFPILRSVTLLLGASLILAGCPSSPGSTAGIVRPNPKLDPAAKCGQLEPLVVEWDPAARGRLESLRTQGLVAVHYEGCDLRVLDCHATGKYAYAAFTPKDQTVAMRDKDSLYANLPVGAASLESKLAAKGELNADLKLVGRYAFERASVRADELTGDCDRATHIVSAMTVGAFKLLAGGSSEVSGGARVFGAGAGGSSESMREELTRDGDPATCKGKPGDPDPPFGCGALIRLELSPITLSDQDRCDAAGARLFSCGVRFNPTWRAQCPKLSGFNSCAKAAGNDCNGLAVCVQRAFAAVCTPSGTATCKRTVECYRDCGERGQSVDECNCACTAGLDPSKALPLLKHNTCFDVYCHGKTGAEGNACFMKNCQADAQECWQN